MARHFIARTLLALLTLATLALGWATPALAASRTVTISEAEINSRYWVTNPRRAGVSERSVDLQSGQLVVNQTRTRRGQEPRQESITLVPTLADGRVTWSASAATVDGEPVSAELLEQINARITASWARFIKERLPNGRITALAITDAEITATVETGE